MTQTWQDRIHDWVHQTDWAEEVEEWEEHINEEPGKRHITFTLFDGSALVVHEDGTYFHYKEELTDSGFIREKFNI